MDLNSEQKESALIVGQTVLDLTVAKRALAILQAKSVSLANSMRVVAQTLHPVTISSQIHTESLESALAKCPSRDEIQTLMSQLKSVQDDIDQLSKALHNMGVDR